jgi:iron complex outermembrane receptor protein
MSTSVRRSLAIAALAALSGPLAAETRIVITAPRHSASEALNTSTLDQAAIAPLRYRSSDTASLLRDLPGLSLYSAGGVSSLPAIHGLADDRLRIKVDGMDLVSACPNHMNSPLSYLDPTAVARAEVYAGVTPVSVGGDSIGGTIVVESAPARFAAPGQTLVTGEAGAFYRSNGDARGANVAATLAGANASFTYTGAGTEANNYDAGDAFKPAGPAAVGRGWLDGDEVGSTAYKAINQAGKLALRSDGHLLELKYAHQHIPYEGFANQRMDMTDNESDQVNLAYTGQYGWGVLKTRVYHEKTDHRMNFGDDKQFWYGTAPGMPMASEGKNTGATINASIPLTDADTLRVGSEYQGFRLDDWWSPSGTGMMMAPNTFWNINDGKRDRYAAFGEWESRWNAQWQSLLGVRYETVRMDTGPAAGYSMMYAADANAFNARDHDKTDHNWDATALARFTPDARQTYELGLAQKTRSPNLYERYTWSTLPMAAVMNNLVGDGNGYVGNLDLDPEIARTVSLAADWHDAAQARWNIRVSPYYTRVEDYIDARCLGTCTVAQFNTLKYTNESARLYGVDLSGGVQLGSTRDFGDFALRGVVNYVNGKNRDTGDDLYNIMPLNARLTLAQSIGRWRNALESEWVARKDKVSDVRNEAETAGYNLIHLRSACQWQQVRLDVGIENLLDKGYALPLGGAYLGQGRTMSINGVPWGTAVAGPGRSFYAAVSYSF